MQINKAEFTKLFANVEANRTAIESILYELAGKISREVKAPDGAWEDIRQDIWLFLSRTIPKYDPDKGNAYSYFYKAGQRFAWKIAEKIQRGEMVSIDDMLMEDSDEQEIPEVSPPQQPIIRKVKDVSKPRKRVAYAVEVLDRILRKAREQHKEVEQGTLPYLQLLSGISFLQQYRFALIKRYYPMMLGNIRYEKDKVIVLNGGEDE